MSPNFNIVLLAAVVAVVVAFCSGCTAARVTTASGVSAWYVDVHPTTASVNVQAVAEGIGAFTVSRESGDATQVITNTASLITKP